MFKINDRVYVATDKSIFIGRLATVKAVYHESRECRIHIDGEQFQAIFAFEDIEYAAP